MSIKNTFRPAVENLEARELLASNVTAVLSNGVLSVKGDNQANHVRIEYVSADAYRVSAITDLGAKTKLNGIPGGQQVFFNVKSLDVRTYEGEDFVQIRNATNSTHGHLHGNLAVDTGSGNHGDMVEVFRMDVRGTTTIQTGGGDDHAFVKSSTLRGGLRLLTGDGNDKIELKDFWFAGASAGSGLGKSEALFVDAGRGHDTLGISLGRVDGQCKIYMGEGQDRVNIRDDTWMKNCYIDGGSGHDTLNTYRNRGSNISQLIFADMNNPSNSGFESRTKGNHTF